MNSSSAGLDVLLYTFIFRPAREREDKKNKRCGNTKQDRNSQRHNHFIVNTFRFDSKTQGT